MKALIVSLSAPEMDRLAVELAARHALTGLVRRYANKGRGWERALAGLPWFGRTYASTLGRRLPPAGLDQDLVVEASLAADFAAAVVNRAGRGMPGVATRISKRMLAWTEAGVAAAGARRASGAEVVVASYHVAYPAFKAARASGRRTILNYPIAHHRWQYRFYADLAARFPGFATALPHFGNALNHAARLDREIELADRILVGSSFVRDTFIAEGIAPERLTVIPYGADLQRFQPSRQPRTERPFRVLFVGQIGERKGISHLLHAYQRFRRTDTELHLVGDYVKGAEVYRPFRGLYRHTANVPQVQLPELFRAADVFLFPSLVEGMPMVVLEAMACGLPVIVTPHGPADVVRDGIDGYVIPVCDVEAIVDRLERLYTNADLRHQMATNAVKQASQWTWQRYAQTAADTVLSGAPVTRVAA